MRYGRYLRLEKNIAASDTGGVRERWAYGCRLLADGTATTPNGNLKNGVRAGLVAESAARGHKLSEREISRRLQCAKMYPTEAQLCQALAQYGAWSDLAEANFPPVELPEGTDPGEPFDPRDADEKLRDANAELERRKAQNPEQLALWDWSPRYSFQGDEHGPRSTLEQLYAACDVSERFTAGMAKYDADRRAYVDDMARECGGNLQASWFEGEKRLQARKTSLEALGVSDQESLDEILDDWYRRNRT